MASDISRQRIIKCLEDNMHEISLEDLREVFDIIKGELVSEIITYSRSSAWSEKEEIFVNAIIGKASNLEEKLFSKLSEKYLDEAYIDQMETIDKREIYNVFVEIFLEYQKYKIERELTGVRYETLLFQAIDYARNQRLEIKEQVPNKGDDISKVIEFKSRR